MDQVSLVKADVRKSQWAEIIKACQSSGMTVKAWCLENGINIKSYYYRLRKRKRKIMPCIINAGAAFASAFLSNMEFFYHLI